ncbi:glycerophosphodiester phosphodiesterase [Psychromonas sp.]|uniref:glycerophosphodiester phosphodiesterase n=1 Tax=Psychromonas sp. TaxID=1884585 RepID=UPI0035624CA2
MIKIYNIAEPSSQISMAPTIIHPLQSLSDLQNIGVSNIYIRIDPLLNMYNLNGTKIGQLDILLSTDNLSVIPVLSIEEPETIEPLSKLLKTENSFDITLISSQPGLINQARDLMPLIRGAVDYSRYDFAAIKDPLHFIAQQTHRAKAKIALLPAQFNSKKQVETLQKRLITAWSADSGTSLSEAVAMLCSGVNGIISDNPIQLQQAMGLFNRHSLLRKPLIIGHRGTPSLLPENSLEGAIKACQLGVDAIEYDIQLSADKQIVAMHDENVKRTTNGYGLIEKMTLAEIKNLRITDRGKTTEFLVPTLEELFAQFANTSLIHFIEIKSNNPEIIQPLKAAIEKYQLADRVVVISFKETQLSRMYDMIPEIPVGFLSDYQASQKTDQNLQQILTATQKFSSTFNPDYKNLTAETMEAAKHRGTTFWTWTFADPKKAQYYYARGMHGLTCDYAQWFADFPVSLIPERNSETIKVGQPLNLTVVLITQAGKKMPAQSIYTVLESSAEYSHKDGSLLFTTPGQAALLLSHRHQMSGGEYYHIYAAPILVTIINA